MADEVNVSIAHSAAKGGGSIGSGSLSYQSDMAGTDMGSNTMPVTTSWTVINIPAAISFPATLTVTNLDATHYVELSVDNAGANTFARIQPGESGHFPGLAALPYVKANVAASQIQWWANEV